MNGYVEYMKHTYSHPLSFHIIVLFCMGVILVTCIEILSLGLRKIWIMIKPKSEI
jgi:hypothetical protein